MAPHELADTLVRRRIPVGESWARPEYSGIYLHARYFDPKLGIFLSPDPIGVAGGMNLYGYGLGNPIRWADRSGLASQVCYITPPGSAGCGTNPSTNPTPNVECWLTTPRPADSGSSFRGFVLGAHAGAGPQIGITNVQSPSQLAGPMMTVNVNTPLGSGQFAFSTGNSGFVYVLSGGGPSVGASVSVYRTNTVVVTAVNRSCK